MGEQKILVGSTQTLVTYPRVGPGGDWLRAVPTVATVRIGTPAVVMPTTYDSATIDSASTTVSVAAEGATTLTVASLSAVRGRRYLVGTLGAVTGAEYIEVESARTGTLTNAALDIAEPLPLAIPASSPLKGWAITHALTAAETEYPGEALALWRATVDGVDYEWSQSFRIVRRIPVSSLTPTRLTQAWPSVRTMRTRQDPSFEELLRTSWEHRILPWLAASGISEEDVIGVDALEPLHALACVQQLALLNPSIAPEVRAALEQRWDQLVSTTLARKDWHATPQDEVPAMRPETPLIRTGIRLMR